ncbi:hypothetical protein PTKU64_89890 [Paraburkholderia terrae]|uniref:Uncharacterized protein n=1 Tax=Paraburkholderia terrae TaxID=311230 RepID=A0ABM7U2E7_9BURK|nr:hypothetical protein PTKU64_89890 [Paraburkholderia terrae]
MPVCRWRLRARAFETGYADWAFCWYRATLMGCERETGAGPQRVNGRPVTRFRSERFPI